MLDKRIDTTLISDVQMSHLNMKLELAARELGETGNWGNSRAVYKGDKIWHRQPASDWSFTFGARESGISLLT